MAERLHPPHYLAECYECDGYGCEYCEGRGYYEVCGHPGCGEPMGNRRRQWKRIMSAVADG